MLQNTLYQGINRSSVTLNFIDMAYQIYFSNPNEFLRNLIIAILRIKKHSKTITENEKQLLVSSGMDDSSESNNGGKELNSKPRRRTPIKNRKTDTEDSISPESD